MLGKLYKPKDIFVRVLQHDATKELESLLFDNRIYQDGCGIKAHTVDGIKYIFDGNYIVQFPDGKLKVYAKQDFEKAFELVEVESKFIY